MKSEGLGSAWKLRQLTEGSDQNEFHSHSYYDINAVDRFNRWIAAYKVRFQGRRPTPEDSVEVGMVDLAGNAGWQKLGESRAWSWQQGPMAQWVGATNKMIWNDRDGDRFISRIVDVSSGERASVEMPIYALSHEGRVGFSLNLSRLNDNRPGYGYVGIADRWSGEQVPDQDGVWRIDLESGATRLILSARRAFEMLKRKGVIEETWIRRVTRRWRHTYWFNHIKVAPDGKRFTVKFRYRPASEGLPWRQKWSFSLTCGVDGSDLRYLVDAASHVMWRDSRRLYFWRTNGLYEYEDAPTGARFVRQIGEKVIQQDSHVVYLPKRDNVFVYDVPYRETVSLHVFEERTGEGQLLGEFENHVPAKGEFRCDLHPCPGPDGKTIVFTSMRDGGRQIYLAQAR